MSTTVDLVVVGAGPAGMAAAVSAGEQGLHVILIDAEHQLGGQYWRHPDESLSSDDEAEGQHGWKVFSELRNRLQVLRRGNRFVYHTDSQVWFVEVPGIVRAPWRLHVTSSSDLGTGGGPLDGYVDATRVILCPGGYDRQLPVPGWDLPGVMAAGGTQALLKGSRTPPGNKAVVAGTGPFLLPVAAGLADAGVEVAAVCEAGNLSGWASNALDAARLPSKGIEAAAYVGSFARHRIPYKPRTVVTRINGDRQVASVTVSKVGPDGKLRAGTERTIEVDHVAFGWGFTPSMELILAVGAETRLDEGKSLCAVVDTLQRSTVSRVYVAGEATGVGGAVKAVAEGELAGLTAASDAGCPTLRRRVKRLQSTVRRSVAFATAMHRAHPVPDNWTDWLVDDTVVCRCEEVTYGDVCIAHDELGAEDSRSIKLLTRPGMGWCQGRVCGFACASITAIANQRPLVADELAALGKRPLAAPISLADLAEDPQ